MSNEKFTPGPWKAHGTYHQDWVTTDWKDTGNQEYICKCGNDNGFENSFLIAAAPKMFNALNKCLDFLQRCPMTRNAELEREIETTLNEATNTWTTK